MGAIDIIFICIIIIMVFVGAKRGLILSLLSMLRFLIGVPLSFAVSDGCNQLVYDNYVRQTAYNYVLDKIQNEVNTQAYIDDLNDTIDQLPFFVKNNFDTSSLSAFSNETIAQKITDNLVEPIAIVVIKIILFIAVLALFYLLTGIIIRIAKKVRSNKNIPFHKTGSFFGGLFALFKSVGLIYVLSAAAGFIVSLQNQGWFAEAVEKSRIIQFINDYNPIL